MNQITPISETAETVTLSRTDFEALLDAIENAATLKAFAQTRCEDSFPAEIVARLTAGESPVKVYRSHRGLTMRDLAAKCGLSAPYISDIENRKLSGSVEALKAIAAALQVDLSDIA